MHAVDKLRTLAKLGRRELLRENLFIFANKLEE